MQVLALLSPNTLAKWPSGRVMPKHPTPGVSGKTQFCDVGLWIKGHLEGSNNLTHKQPCGPNKAPE